MKKCPWCAELIQDEAIICRYCQRSVAARPDVTPSEESARLIPARPDVNASDESALSGQEEPEARGHQGATDRVRARFPFLFWMVLPWIRWYDFMLRSRRREYWAFLFGATLAGIFWMVLLFALQSLWDGFDSEGGLPIVIIGLYLFFILTTVPSYAVTVRRLHDIGLSGWFSLLVAAPAVFEALYYLAPIQIILTIGTIGQVVFTIMNSILFLVLGLTPGKAGANRYGPDPKLASSYGA